MSPLSPSLDSSNARLFRADLGCGLVPVLAAMFCLHSVVTHTHGLVLHEVQISPQSSKCSRAPFGLGSLKVRPARSCAYTSLAVAQRLEKTEGKRGFPDQSAETAASLALRQKV